MKGLKKERECAWFFPVRSQVFRSSVIPRDFWCTLKVASNTARERALSIACSFLILGRLQGVRTSVQIE